DCIEIAEIHVWPEHGMLTAPYFEYLLTSI
ncbi:unnamed protein product, partial [marine sediment metagenome]